MASPPLFSAPSLSDSLFRGRGLCKDYSVRVLEGVDLEVAAGEVHALLGANGAGKSTLCRILAGLTPASCGGMTLAGEVYQPERKHEAEARGVQIVQQELNLVPTLSVAENLFMNRLPSRLGWIDFERLRRDSRRALERVGLGQLDPDTPTGSLGVGTQQLIEVASALARECRLLILDEPTAALTENETERLFERLRQLKTSGIGVLYVSHRLEEIQLISDRLTVLRDGRRVGSLPTSGVSIDEMVAMMTGEGTSATTTFESHRRQEIALRAERISLAPMVREASFVVRRGERLGIAGLVGAGRTELLRCLFGAERAEEGSVSLGEGAAPRRFAHPRNAVRHGLAMVTEDRKRDGLLLPLSLRVNTTLPDVPHRFGWVERRSEVGASQSRREELDIRCRSVEQPAEELSGGNQQKVVLAKWLECDAEVFLLDEPTRGIDVAAREKIYQLFDDLARRGKALVIVSSDLDELMEHCDRIVVMCGGRLVAQFERESWSRHEIMAAAFPGSASATVGAGA